MYLLADCLSEEHELKDQAFSLFLGHLTVHLVLDLRYLDLIFVSQFLILTGSLKFLTFNLSLGR